MTMTQEQLDTLDAIDKNGEGLGSWEIDFISSMVDRVKKYGLKTIISQRQTNKLDTIYHERMPEDWSE